MCGIFGYIGNRQANRIILEGLKKLEYRGYDSAGVSVFFHNEIITEKCIGEVSNLNLEHLKGYVGIGHTRWATHGKPTLINAHPHNSNDMAFSVVHNGIIENYIELKKEIESTGYKFISETDSEIIPALLQIYYKGNMAETVLQVVNKLKGSYAVAFLSVYSKEIYIFKSGSPLVVGTGEYGKCFASDLHALSGSVSSYYVLNDNEIAILADEIQLFNFNGDHIKVDLSVYCENESPYDKNGYEHYMLKEINEQPEAIKNTINEFNNKKSLLSEFKFNNIYILGCGSAYNAAKIGEFAFENLCKIKCKAIIASEFSGNMATVTRNDLIIAISQSGETSDTLTSVKIAKKIGCKILSVINVKNSTLADLSDFVFYTEAGKEISVATTKCYTSQVLMLILIANYLSTDSSFNVNVSLLIKEVSDVIETNVGNVINRVSESDTVFFLGKGIDYFTAEEGALKLKEVSYINAQAYPSGEIKHGSIALVDDKTTVIVVCTDKNSINRNISAIKEVKSRGAYVISVVSNDCEEIMNISDCSLVVGTVNKYINCLLSVIPLQLISYHTGIINNSDVDKPKNLAKSVTVE